MINARRSFPQRPAPTPDRSASDSPSIGRTHRFSGMTVRPARDPFQGLSTQASGRRSLGLALLTALILGTFAAPAGAQSQARKLFAEPILIHAPYDHTAPIRSLLFSSDGSQLLSGGQDKVIHVWNVQSNPIGRAQSLRPPIWRSLAGHIHCMALSPPQAADKDLEGLLAIAGVGASANRGDILLYRYPGTDGSESGHFLARLPFGGFEGGTPDGHKRPVNSLAFSRDGRYLASGSADGRVKIWDTRSAIHPENAQTPLVKTLPRDEPAIDPPATDGPPVIGVGFLNNECLVIADETSILSLWDLRDARHPRRLVTRSAQWANLNGHNGLKAFVVSPDGRWVVIGQEHGCITRFDAALSNPQFLTSVESRGPVLSLAISPDSKSVASGTVLSGARENEVPSLESVVEIRGIMGGPLWCQRQTTSHVQALAFGPDRRSPRLAFAGGDRNELHFWDFLSSAEPIKVNRMPATRSGMWDLPRTRSPSASPGKGATDRALPGLYELFDLNTHEFRKVDPAQLDKAVKRDSTGSIEPIDLYRLRVTAGRASYVLPLNQNTDGRWWSSTLLPANQGAGRNRLMVAVGCDYGVALYRIDSNTLTRVRFLSSHNGAVLALAFPRRQVAGHRLLRSDDSPLASRRVRPARPAWREISTGWRSPGCDACRAGELCRRHGAAKGRSDL